MTNTHETSSRLLEQAVDEFSRLPGIGRKTALRLVLHLLRISPADVESFADSLVTLVHEVKYCRHCHNICDEGEECGICSNPLRDTSKILVVENFSDVMLIESTAAYRGLYHVLGGVISPIDGITPHDLQIDSLVERVGQGEVREVILALSSTMEGDTTSFYIYRRLANVQNLQVTTLARGLSVGDELQYTDEATLARSIQARSPFNQ